MVTRKNRLKYGAYATDRPTNALHVDLPYSDGVASINASWIVPDIKPLSSGERGIILSTPVKYEGASLSTLPFNMADIRYAILFFDKVLYASNNVIHIPPPPEIEWLDAYGVAETVTVIGTGHFDARCVIEAQKTLFRKLDADLPGVWGIGRGESHAMFTVNEIEAQRGLCMKLFGAIPVPDQDVPLEDILDFRGRRRPELLSLRCYIEELYQDIISKPDQKIAERTAFDKLGLAIADHIKVMRESKLKFRFSDISMKFTAQDAVVGVVAGSAAAQTANLNLLESLGIGFAAALSKSFLSLSIDINVAGRKSAPSPFEYVSRYHSEIFNNS